MRGLGGAALAGIALTIGAGVWLRRLKNDNPYRGEIAALHEERGRLNGDVNRARRQAASEWRMSFHLNQLQVRF